MPKVDDVARLAEVYGVLPEVREKLLLLADRVARDADHKRAVLNRGVARRQVAVVRAEAVANIVRVFCVSGVPARLHQDIWTGKRLIVVMPEGALRTSALHWDRFREVAAQPNVEVGVIPWYTAVEVPDSGFQVFDGHMVVIELLAGNVVITDPDDVRGHLEQFDMLRHHAVSGDDLRQLLDSVEAEYERVTMPDQRRPAVRSRS